MATKKRPAVRTIPPLRLDDLDGRRFDSLVRQLVWGFRRWKSIEPADDVPHARRLVAIEVIGDGLETTTLERTWIVQASAEASAPPKTIRRLVRDAVPDLERAPYGIVVAVPASVTKAGLDAYHDEASQCRVREAHLWSRAMLEEMLLRPENDALLFAYFGVSQRIRPAGRIAEIRRDSATKRTLMATFGDEATVKDIGHHDVLVRSTFDEAYPSTPVGVGANRSWHFARTFSLGHDRLGLELEDWIGVRRPDGTWDVDDATCVTREKPSKVLRDDPVGERRSRERALLERAIAEGERVRVIGVGWIPLKRIVEVDRIGTPGEGVPHLFCDFASEKGPYAGFSRIAYTGGWPTHLDEAKRDRSIFYRLRAETDLSDEAYAAYQRTRFSEPPL